MIAEGVENERQANLLMHMHCDEIQGYLYSAPVAAADARLGTMGADVADMPVVGGRTVTESAPGMEETVAGRTGTGSASGMGKTVAGRTDRRRHPRIVLPSPLVGKITISRIQHRQVKVSWSPILVSNISPEGLEFASSLRLPADRHTVLRVQMNILCVREPALDA